MLSVDLGTSILSSSVFFFNLLAIIPSSIQIIFDRRRSVDDFFWFNEPEEKKRNKRKKPQLPSPMPEIPRSKPLISLTKTAGGFALSSTENFTAEKLPHEIKVEVAYEVGKGNAFKRYSPHDFKLGKNGVSVASSEGGVKVISSKHNVMELLVNQVPFNLKVNGFDQNRDLKVKVR